jgi:ElaA protein
MTSKEQSTDGAPTLTLDRDHLEWHLSPFEALSTRQWHQIAQARIQVFVVEQRCPYQELDGKDPHCQHLCGWQGDELAAYLRLVPPGLSFAEPSLGRILTAGFARRGGIGQELVRRGIGALRKRYPQAAIRIGAQRYLERFYQSFGFETASAPFDEDGIEHIEMLRPCTAS